MASPAVGGLEPRPPHRQIRHWTWQGWRHSPSHRRLERRRPSERASKREEGGEERGRTCVRRCAARREAHEKPTKAAGGNRCADLCPVRMGDSGWA